MKTAAPPEWHRLFNAALNDQLSAADQRQIATLLKSSAEARQLWFLYLDNECSLAELKPSVRPRPAFRWFSWRPLTAAAAGIVLGMFFTSVVSGYVMPRAVVTASRLFALVDGSFEEPRERLGSGFPVQFGVWSGDEAEIVGGTSVAAGDGKRALCFKRAQREPVLPHHGAASCDMYQLVDLTSLQAVVDRGEAMLELTARFLDARPNAGEEVKFICRLFVFSGTPDTLPAEWPLSQKESLAAGSACFNSHGGAPTAWQKVTAKVLLPPGAAFAVIHLLVHKPKNPVGTEATFGEQFADDVRLTLKTQPTLPVRLAQR
jgi:hypothetical protein